MRPLGQILSLFFKGKARKKNKKGGTILSLVKRVISVIFCDEDLTEGVENEKRYKYSSSER